MGGDGARRGRGLARLRTELVIQTRTGLLLQQQPSMHKPWLQQPRGPTQDSPAQHHPAGALPTRLEANDQLIAHVAQMAKQRGRGGLELDAHLVMVMCRMTQGQSHQLEGFVSDMLMHKMEPGSK